MDRNNSYYLIKDILSNYFEAVIINNENYLKSNKIKSKIADFTKGTFDWIDKDNLFKDLKSAFTNYVLDDQTHFFYNDRCLRIYALSENGNYFENYQIRVSIFNLFSVCSRNYYIKNKKNFLDPLIYYNPGEIFFADTAYEILIKYYPKILWIEKEFLIKPLCELNMFEIPIRNDISLNDVLFTENT